VPSPNVATGAAQATLNVLTTTPGAPNRDRAPGFCNGRVHTHSGQYRRTNALSGPQPTFTFPAAFVEATLPPRAAATSSQGGVPPIVPIIALAGVGLFGLLVSALRRLYRTVNLPTLSPSPHAGRDLVDAFYSLSLRAGIGVNVLRRCAIARLKASELC